MPTSKQFSDVVMRGVAVFMRRSAAAFNRIMKESSLSMPQFHTMMRIYYSGPRGVSDIAQDVGFTKAASSQMVDRLVRMGMLTRTENPNDRRERQIGLTEKGQQMIEQFIDSSSDWLEVMLKKLPAEKQDEAFLTLRSLVELDEVAEVEA
jgi:DNA-binding MarR family transcriptional regulator